MPSTSDEIVAYRFGPFRLIVADRILERDGERVVLTPKVIDTLFVLVENARQVVSKELLMQRVWPDVTVVESGLTRNISILRKALEEGLAEGSMLETIPRRGYRFIVDVEVERVCGVVRLGEIGEAGQVGISVVGGGEKGTQSVKGSGKATAVVIALAVAAALVIGWFAVRSPRASPAGPPEAEVRIGEHLLMKVAPGESLQAEEHFAMAIASNPNSAGGHAGLAAAMLQSAIFGVRGLSESMPRAERLARRALELNERSGMAHYAMGLVHITKDWDMRAARQDMRRALELEPGLVPAWAANARIQVALGDLSAAQASLEEALRLDPASPHLGADYCQVFYFGRDFRRAELECSKVLEREPGFALARYVLALSLGMMGRLDEAGDALGKSAMRPGVVEADRAWLSVLRGEKGPALELLERRREMIRKGQIDASAKLLLATILERRDEAMEALETAVAKRAPELLSIGVDPRLEPLRADPRYRKAVEALGLAGQFARK